METPPPWRVLEFYSGIGGMRYALASSGVRAEVVEAFDINDVANDVYEHNFGHRPCQGNIQTLTAGDLDKYQAHAWLLSPPCQPYTRQGLQKHSADARAFSFIKILNLMQNMSFPPQMLFVENVVGFEVSDTHDQLLAVLSTLNFNTQEFILSPLQFGVPYSRPRYFCLAKQESMCFPNSSVNDKLLRTPTCLTLNTTRTQNSYDQNEDDLEVVCNPIRNFLEAQSIGDKECSAIISDFKEADECTPIETASHDYTVPLNLIERYYCYVKGTGSVLVTSKNLKPVPKENLEMSSLNELGLRFFTPQRGRKFAFISPEFPFSGSHKPQTTVCHAG
ncbi:unnamed protein product [Triticum turgidum subsp. durum]|uniref:Uncharacterized protein n=1 Tax=Triticum turgidum subsp. durum TaxID=4567 RepID=A0A9R0RNG1_TRITD|nr:unnamed protein product [Triticum turgidum subsp. durum]